MMRESNRRPWIRRAETKHYRRAELASSLVLAAVLCGCGYVIMGTNERVPGEIHSVSIGAFENRSREFGLDKSLAFALEREFYQRGVVPLVENPEGGEGVITGTIRQFRTRPVSFNSQDEATQYESELIVDVILKRRSDGAVLWKGNGMHAVDDYAVDRQFVVPSSSQFQRGTLNFNNLEQLTDIQLAETEKRLAVERLVRSIVRDVHDRILDGF